MNLDRNICSICAHPHRVLIDARLLAKKPDGTNVNSADAVAAWMKADGLTPLPIPRTLNRHRKKHLNVSDEVAKRRMAQAEARERGETAPPVETLPEALETAVLAEMANVDMLDRWADRLGRMGDFLIDKLTKKGADGSLPPPPEPQEVSFMVHGARAGAAIATARNAILTGNSKNRGILGSNDDQKGLKEFVEGITKKAPAIEGDRSDTAPPPTKEELERALSNMSEGDLAADAYGVDEEPDAQEGDDPTDVRPGPVVDVAPPDSGPTLVSQPLPEGVPPVEVAAVPYSYKPPPAATRPLPLRLVGGNK